MFDDKAVGFDLFTAAYICVFSISTDLRLFEDDYHKHYSAMRDASLRTGESMFPLHLNVVHIYNFLSRNHSSNSEVAY